MSSSVDRSGRRIRKLIGVNLPAPARAPAEFMKHGPGTSMGASVSVSEFLRAVRSLETDQSRTNRWAIKPELGFRSQLTPGFRSLRGAWFFETNDDFFGGHVRQQDPLATFQGTSSTPAVRRPPTSLTTAEGRRRSTGRQP